ncbi:MAG: DUF4253 domain-containing protein [Actinobacteria bacterium]|nr:DUF4253 domain-containing protein [Actinomycetota bacterium]
MGDFWTTLGLVPVQRPADVTWALGWTGDTNHGRDQASAASLYRSWEDRFGAYIVRLGFAEVVLSVARPPTELSEARLVALEHYAWCPTLDEHGVDIEEYATSLLDSNSWGCWWD